MADDRLRFDFTHAKPMSVDELAKVEVSVNAAIARTLPVSVATVPLEKAKAIAGVRAVFGEKYPDPVRVVSIGAKVGELLADPANAKWRQCSVEFCGGTHLPATGEAKRFAIVSEGALSAGVRRVMALAGVPAEAAFAAAKGLH